MYPQFSMRKKNDFSFPNWLSFGFRFYVVALCRSLCCVVIIIIIVICIFSPGKNWEIIWHAKCEKKKTKAARRPTRTHAHTAIMKRQKRQSRKKKMIGALGVAVVAVWQCPIYGIYLYIYLYIYPYIWGTCILHWSFPTLVMA